MLPHFPTFVAAATKVCCPVTERIPAPNRCISRHERREVHRAIAIEFILSDDSEREHIDPVRWRVDVVAVEDLGNRVVDKAAAQRRDVKQNDQREERGGGEEWHALHVGKVTLDRGLESGFRRP